MLSVQKRELCDKLNGILIKHDITFEEGNDHLDKYELWLKKQQEIKNLKDNFITNITEYIQLALKPEVDPNWEKKAIQIGTIFQMLWDKLDDDKLVAFLSGLENFKVTINPGKGLVIARKLSGTDVENPKIMEFTIPLTLKQSLKLINCRWLVS